MVRRRKNKRIVFDAATLGNEPIPISEDEDREYFPVAAMAELSVDYPVLNFYVEQRVDCFVERFKPCNEREPMCYQFTESKLRAFFKAYVCTNGDPLKIYLAKLADEGFIFSTTVTGEPVLYVTDRFTNCPDNSWLLEMEQTGGASVDDNDDNNLE